MIQKIRVILIFHKAIMKSYCTCWWSPGKLVYAERTKENNFLCNFSTSSFNNRDVMVGVTVEVPSR